MEKLNKLLQAQFKVMCATGKLFKSSLTGRQVWKLYLDSFEEKHDPTFRDPNSSTHNCNHCNNFIKRYGNVVAIDENYNIITLFDVVAEEEYKKSVVSMSEALKSAPIGNVFFETFEELKNLPYESCSKSNEVFRLGVDKNPKRYTKAEAELYGGVKPNEVRIFHHFHLDLPKQYVDTTGKSIESIQADYRSAKDVFLRAMVEIPSATLELVRDLISQGSLLDGETHLYKVEQILPLKKDFDKTDIAKRDNWAWVVSNKLSFAKFKNELIGVLCTELAEGEELNKACQSWNKRVDPANYMKAVAPITEGQKKAAKEFVEENGYVESFDRRHATLDDIKVTEIKHINVGSGKISEVSIFDNVKTKSSQHKRNKFEGIEEVGIEKFMETILPTCTSVEALVENRHEGNFVNLTTITQEDCKPIFKWDNPYSWTYKGNLAGKSQIKEAVKSQGGRVDGVLRFSIMWAEDDLDSSDLDAHCIEPNKNTIYYSSKRSRFSGGNLDIDITQPQRHKRSGREVVENITFPDLSRMQDGVYKMIVHQYSERNSQGFKAEIEFNGESFTYEYNQRVSGKVHVADVILKNGEFSIVHKLPSENATKEIYGLETNNFHKVNLVCLSPNHWGGNKTGNKHFFFMLDKCKADVSLRSFHSENLEPDLAKHRKVLEVLGAVNMIEPSENQLAGLGFNATVRDEVILKLGGNFKRTIKVKF